MTDELLYLVDKNDKIIGSVWKSEAHKNSGLIHRELAVVVFNDKSEVLLQQRSLKKEHDPGQWKLSAAGHVGFNEDMVVAVKREVFEELGINVKPVFYKKDYQESSNQSRFFWIYYATVVGQPRLVLQSEEVSDAKWIHISKLNDFAKDKPYFLQSLSYRLIIEIAEKLKIT